MIACPHCKKPDCDDSDTYCSNCGKPIRNYCTNPLCENGDQGAGLAPLDVFCPVCGAKSIFFSEGIIEPQTFDD